MEGALLMIEVNRYLKYRVILVNLSTYVQPNYFKKQHFYLPEVNLNVQEGHGVLSSLVLCI